MARMYEEASERRRFSVDDLSAMVDAGIIGPDEHVELLDGEIFLMGKQGPRHRALSIIVRELLGAAYGGKGHVQDHSNLRLDDFNLPEPDVAVIRGDARAYLERLPTGADVFLVVEVTVTSHARDRRKVQTYAHAGIPEYWMLDVAARTLTVHRDPEADTYATVAVHADTSHVAVPGTAVTLAVNDLLP